MVIHPEATAPNDEGFTRYKELLAKLVSFRGIMSLDPDPKYASSSVDATHYVGNYLKELGAEVTYTKEFVHPPGSDARHQGMVAVFYPPDADRTKSVSNALAFAAHIDVVPPTPTADGRDLFTLTEKGDKLFGRGAADMKGPIAAALTVLDKNKDRLKDTKRPVAFFLSPCEEGGSKGITHVCELAKSKGIYPSEILFTAPTESHIGIGGTGGIAHKIVLAAKESAPARPYDAAVKITFTNPTSYPFLGAAVKNPAQYYSMLNDSLLKWLKDSGTQAEVEICKAEIGNPAGIIAADESSIVLGLRGDKHAINHAIATLKNRKLPEAIAKVYSTVVGVFTRSLKSEYALDTGGINIGIKEVPAEEVKALKPAPSGNAVEAALKIAGKIAKLDGSYKSMGKLLLGKPSGEFSIAPFADPNESVVYCGGDGAKMEMLLLGSGRMKYSTDKMDADLTAVFDGMRKEFEAQGIDMKVEKLAQNESHTVSDKALVDSYVNIAKKTGFSKKGRAPTNIPYPSDAGSIREFFPEAQVFLASSVGLSNSPHAPLEHITRDQAVRDMAFYHGVLREKALDAAAHIKRAGGERGRASGI